MASSLFSAADKRALCPLWTCYQNEVNQSFKKVEQGIGILYHSKEYLDLLSFKGLYRRRLSYYLYFVYVLHYTFLSKQS